MAALIWIAAALVMLVLLALLMPWHLRFRGTTAPLALRLHLRLLGGYAPGIPIPLTRSTDREGAREQRQKRKTRKPRRKRAMPRGLRDLVFGVLSAFRVQRLRLTGRIGLHDPADTGTLWGCLTPAIYGLSGGERRIDIAPEFSGACLDLTGSGELVIRPLRLLRAGLAFAWANRGAP
jgi:hypothetical protein